MRTVFIWRDNTDYARTVEEWIREFGRRTGKEIESVDPDSPEGKTFCRAYDIVEYPTILALNDDGSVLSMWRGTMLPTFDEVNYWTMQ